MQTAARPSRRSMQEIPPAAPTNPDRLATMFRELQAELTALVSTPVGVYPPEERIRHALAGSIKLYDAIILAGLLEASRPMRILEVGSFIGFSTRWLLESSQSWNAMVVSVDPGIRHRVFDDPAEILRQFNARFLNSRLIQKCGFFSQRMTGDYYWDYEHYLPFIARLQVDAIMASRPVLDGGNLGERDFDFIFVDGDHSEKAVISNFSEALELLNPGGQIAFHDAITWPEVNGALSRIAREFSSLGEVSFHGEEFRHGPVNSCDGIGVFRSSGIPA